MNPSRPGDTEGDDETSGAGRSAAGRIYRSVVPTSVREHHAGKFVIALLAVLIVVGTVGVVTYIQIQGTIGEDATATLETTAELQAATTSEWIDGMESRTAMMAGSRDLPLPSTDRAATSRYLRRHASADDARIVAVHYVDTDSQRIVASSDERFRNRSLGTVDSGWADPAGDLLDPASDGVAVSDRQYSIGGERAVAFAATIQSADRLVVLGRPTPTLLQNTDSGSYVSTHLLSDRGNAIVGNNSALADSKGFQSAREGSTTTVEVDGQIRTYTPIEGANWVAVSAAETGDLYAVSETVGRNVIVLVAAGLVSVIVVGAVLGRHTMGPLATLRDRTRAIEKGDLDIDLSTDREDEIGRLYRSFASMRDALRQQVQQAEEAKRDAEQSRQEMERQNRRLDQFASTLSHDLRNPLAVARGHVELLDTKLDPEQDVLRGHVQKIDGAHDRIDSIINDVLTLTRKGESVEETERFDLKDIATEAWSNIDNKDATLTVEESITIEGDRSRLLRALENLFRNAIDHVGADVSVAVGLTEDGFYVQDDGPGIPDEEINSIFEYGHTTSEDGTGIGLSIVKTIAEAHGWMLWIDGTYEGGARFVFADVFDSEERLFEEAAFTWDNATGDDD